MKTNRPTGRLEAGMEANKEWMIGRHFKHMLLGLDPVNVLYRPHTDTNIKYKPHSHIICSSTSHVRLQPFHRRRTITGSAVALHSYKAHAKITRKIENSTPCKIVTHEDFNLKLGTRDYITSRTSPTVQL